MNNWMALRTRKNSRRKAASTASLLAWFVIMTFLAIGAAPGAVTGAEYPARAIEFVVPYPPGGVSDIAARSVQAQMAADLKVPILVVNKPGGGGAVAAEYVARSKPDGYTVFASPNNPLTIVPSIERDLPYRPSDFGPIGTYMEDRVVIMTRPGTPWTSLDELVAYARKNPGKLSYGSTGPGSAAFLSMEMLKSTLGLDLAHVPFAGAAPLKTALLGDHVPLATGGMSGFVSVIKSGHVVPLVTSGTKRVLANVPAMAEKGVPGVGIWLGLYVPAQTPKNVVEKLERMLETATKQAALIAAAEKVGMTVEFRDAETTRRAVETEQQAIVKLVEKLGLRK